MKPFALAVLLAAGLAPAVPLRAATPDSSRAAATDTLPRVVPIAGIEVSTTAPGDRAPLARTVLDRKALLERNTGLDTPMQIANLPGVYAYSDAGNGIGYSYLSIRGFPQRRISVLVNGVPLNDPESHEVYWIDHPDLLASASELQVQRGVGSALYGAASVGGSVNIETSPFTEARAIGATAAVGSFDTRRLSLEMGSGELGGGWNLYGRYSRIETDGYRERSDSELWSYLFAARRRAGDHSVRVNLYGGPENTHLAYLGVPPDYLAGNVTGDADTDRRFNPIRFEGERDNFFEPHYELIHAWSPSPRTQFTQTLFYFDGEGWYDEQRLGSALADYRLSPWTTTDSTLSPRDYYAQNPDGSLTEDAQGRFTLERFDVVRRRLVQNRHYGWVPRLRLGADGRALTVGGELRAHDGRHIGSVLSAGQAPPGFDPGQRYYDYHPQTLSAGLFARAEWTMRGRLDWTADLAWRHQDYAMRGDQFDGIRFDQPYDFAIPRLGVNWRAARGLDVFAAYARARREPAFRDLYDAESAGSLPLYGTIDVPNGIYEDPLVTPESVNDWELGARWQSAGRTGGATGGEPALGLGANLFRMDFEDELVYAGQFNTDLGYPTVGNAARSTHQGLELNGRWAWRAQGGGERVSGLVADANLSLSDHHFVEYREVYGTAPGDTVRYDGNTIGFFPNTTANLSLRGDWRGATLGFAVQHIGRIYVDNTETDANSIAPRTVVDMALAQRFARRDGSWVELALRIANLLDERYEGGGYMDYDAGGTLVPHLVPAATRSWTAQVRVGL